MLMAMPPAGHGPGPQEKQCPLFPCESPCILGVFLRRSLEFKAGCSLGAHQERVLVRSSCQSLPKSKP